MYDNIIINEENSEHRVKAAIDKLADLENLIEIFLSKIEEGDYKDIKILKRVINQNRDLMTITKLFNIIHSKGE